MTKSQSIVLKNITDQVNLPLDIIENTVRLKLSLLDGSKDAYLILSYLDNSKKRRNLVKLSHITDVKTNLHFVVDIITTAISICRIDKINTLLITYGSLNSEVE